MTGVLRRHRGQVHVKTQAGAGVTQPQAAERPEPAEVARGRRGPEPRQEGLPTPVLGAYGRGTLIERLPDASSRRGCGHLLEQPEPMDNERSIDPIGASEDDSHKHPFPFKISATC